jgi:hypothetical protein
MELTIREFNQLILTVVLLSVATQLGGYYFHYEGIGLWLLFATLWVPVIACLLNGETTRRVFRRGLTTINFKWLILGGLTGLFLLVGEQLVIYLWDLGQFNEQSYYIDTLTKQVSPHGVMLLLGNDTQSYLWFSFNIVLTLLITGIFASLIFTVGFEACWRGVLFRQLALVMGNSLAPVFIGLLIAVCFIPLNLSGYLNEHSPYLTAFLYCPLICIGLSYLMAALAIDNASVWPTAFALGTYIVGSNNLLLVTTDASSSLEAKVIILTLTSLWVRSALISRGEQFNIDESDENSDHEPLMLPLKNAC